MIRSNVLMQSGVERASQGYGDFLAAARMMEQEWPDDAADCFLLAARSSSSAKQRHDAAKRAYEIADSRLLMNEALEVRVEAARSLFFVDEGLDAALTLYDASATAMAHNAYVAGPLYENMTLASRRLCEEGLARWSKKTQDWPVETKGWAKVWYENAHKSLEEWESVDAHVQVALAARALYLMTRGRHLLVERYKHLVKAAEKSEIKNGIGLLRMAAKTAGTLAQLGYGGCWHKRMDECYWRIGALRKV